MARIIRSAPQALTRPRPDWFAVQVDDYYGYGKGFGYADHGGALVHEKIVLTAAHTLKKWDGRGNLVDRVRPGDCYVLGRQKSCEFSGEEEEQVQVKSIRVAFEDGLRADLGIVVLEHPATRIHPATVSTDATLQSFSELYYVGWNGSVEFGEDCGESLHTVLFETPRSPSCQAVDGQPCDGRKFGPYELCARPSVSGTGIVPGDSGGPLIGRKGQDLELVGVAREGKGNDSIFVNIACPDCSGWIQRMISTYGS